MEQMSEIVLYQPEGAVSLEVRLENETVWLTQQQITELFQRERTVITRHINNVFKEKELDEKSNVHFLHIANSDKPVKIYSLDVIISVGYRVKSQRGTQFRQWANKVLKEYMLKGYAINQRIESLEKTVADHSEKIDFFVRHSLPPIEGIFFAGQIFDAYKFVCDLVKSARKSIVLFDNYIDESVLTLFGKRGKSVSVVIYTDKITPQLELDIKRFNAQYSPVKVKLYTKAHDRFLIIDGEIYHIGASLKDLGKKLFAFSKISAIPPELIYNNL
jgi:hypothetical protein